MKVVLQRVTQAKVNVNKKIVGEIGLGLVLLVGIEDGDRARVREIAKKILN